MCDTSDATADCLNGFVGDIVVVQEVDGDSWTRIADPDGPEGPDMVDLQSGIVFDEEFELAGGRWHRRFN
ncbi:hypothetical protein ACWCPF_34950 [Streptomyces sp. NPDC001858]